MPRIFKSISIVIHAIVIGIVSYSQVLNPGLLPSPRSALAFEPVPIVVKDIPLPPAPRRASPDASHVSANAAPIVAPSGVTPETGHEPDVARPSEPGAVDGIPGGIGSGDAIGHVAPPPAPPQPPPPPRPEVYPVGGAIRPPVKIVNVNPVYPQVAQAARKEGVVILEVIIDTAGRVEKVRVLRGEPLLDQAAVTAVQQWRFAPATLNGQVVPVVMTVTVHFQLTK